MEREKASKPPFSKCTRVLNPQNANINTIRPFCACIVGVLLQHRGTPIYTPSRYAVVSRILYIIFSEFFLFFIFSVLFSFIYICITPNLPFYLPYNRSNYFLGTISRP